MTVTVTEAQRLAATRRPNAAAAGYHRWHDLSFIHWRVPAETIQSLLPDGLSVDTFDGSAWLGLVPFDMTGVRPWWSPSVPGVSHFHETNVRTYVHRNGGDPGVWFFSLDASRSLPVRLARRFWHLPYHRSEMSIEKSTDRLHYRSRRQWPAPVPADCSVDICLGDWLPAKQPGYAEPGTLDHFLVERYILYAQSPKGRLFRGQVHHHPYRLRTAQVTALDESLCAAAGFPVADPPVHVAYSAGVDVEIFRLQQVETGCGIALAEPISAARP